MLVFQPGSSPAWSKCAGQRASFFDGLRAAAEAVFDAVVQDEIQLLRLEPVVISQHPVHVVEPESGAKVTRAQLDAMMSEIRTGKVARVVVYKLERLGQSLTHLALILDELQRLSVSLICTSQCIDTSGDNPPGRLQLGVLMAVAEFERSLIRGRVNAGLRDAKGRGVRLGRPSTLADRREEILQLKAQGVGLRETVRRLGVPASSVAKVIKAAGHAAAQKS